MRRRQLYSVCSITGLALALALTCAQAGQVKLAWDPPTTTTGLAGYKLRYGRASGSYTTTINIGNHTSHTVSGLTDGATYYFVATAYNSSGHESGFSNEVRYTVPAASTSQALLSARFESSTDGFAYVDDAFRSTRQPSYASGDRSTGALRVTLGGINDTDITHMSGGWRRTFTVGGTTTAGISVTFRYNMTQTPHYENGEYSDVLATVGTQYLGANGRVARLIGNGNNGSALTTGWQMFTTTLQLAPGTYVLTLGGYNNAKTTTQETTTVLIDDVVVTMSAQAPQSVFAPVASLTDSSLTTSRSSNVRDGTVRRATRRTHAALETDVSTVSSARARRNGSHSVTSTTSTHRIAVTEPDVKIWLEAEEGLLGSLTETGFDDEASAGQYIWTPESYETIDESSHDAGLVQYPFTVPQDGTYVMWGRVSPETSGTRAFLVTVEETVPMTLLTATPYSLVWATPSHEETASASPGATWAWGQVASDTLPVFFLTAGEYTLTMQQLDSGTKLDRILVTNDLEYRP